MSLQSATQQTWLFYGKVSEIPIKNTFMYHNPFLAKKEHALKLKSCKFVKCEHDSWILFVDCQDQHKFDGRMYISRQYDYGKHAIG